MDSDEDRYYAEAYCLDKTEKTEKKELVKKINSFNDILDGHKKGEPLDLLKHIPSDHLIARMVAQSSAQTWISPNTTFLAGISIFSSMSVRKYGCSYRHGGVIPIGMYAIIEQPTSQSKGWCASVFLRPFRAAKISAFNRVEKMIDELESLGTSQTDDDKRELKRLKKYDSTPIITNTTPEALEDSLFSTRGFFSCVSTEQELIKTIVGLSYGNGVSNNEIILNGFDGGEVGTKRIGRRAYYGNVAGAFVSFAQSGSIEKVLDTPGVTGYSQRFFMLAEEDNLGNRDHLRVTIPDKSLEYEYDKCCEFIEEILVNPVGIFELSMLSLSDWAWNEIGRYRNILEPLINSKNRGKFSPEIIRGMIGKADMHIVKISSNLHLLTPQRFDRRVNDRWVTAAILIFNDLMIEAYYLFQNMGLIGERAEFQSILSLFTKDPRQRTERQIIETKRNTEPFKHLKNPAEAIRKTLAEMLNEGILRHPEGVSNVKSYVMAQ